MSPRTADPTNRAALVEAAARILNDEGPGALTTRRLAHELGTSTMVVYTHFDGKDDLMAAIGVEAFRRLGAQLDGVPVTDDPVADLAGLGRAYHRNARRNPALYRVVFGAGLPHHLEPDDETMARGTFETLVRGTDRCMRAGRFLPADPFRAAEQLWASAHGVVMLELAGFFVPVGRAAACLDDSVCSLAIGLGDDPDRARRSVVGTSGGSAHPPAGMARCDVPSSGTTLAPPGDGP